MPFTPSHVVAVLPIAWCCRRIPLSALAIGSMIPDLPLFFPIVSYWSTHDFTKVISICLPLGMVAFVTYHLFLKMPLLSLCPGVFHGRLARHATGKLEISLRYWLFVALGIVIGANTHILWDSFTHGDRWGTQTFPILNEMVNVGGRRMAIFRFMQHASSVGGLAILAVIGLSFLINREPVEQPLRSSAHPSLKFLAAILAAFVPALIFAYTRQFNYTTVETVGITIRLSGALLTIALVSYSLCFHIATRYRFVEP